MSTDSDNDCEQLQPTKTSQPPVVDNAQMAGQYPLITWVYSVELLIFVVGVLSFVFAHEPIDSRPAVVLFGGGLTAALLSVPLVWLISRRRSDSGKHFRRLVVLGLFTLPMGIFGLGMASNSLFDTSQPQSHNVLTTGEPTACTGDNRWVAVQDWRDDQRTFAVELQNVELCDAIEQGDTLVLSVREGLWGWTWISDVRLAR
jgi:hypothetical protein